MKSKTLFFVALLLLAPAIYLAAIWPSLPQRVPLHFDFNGNADRYGSKTEVVRMIAMLSLVSGALFLLFSNIHRAGKWAPAQNKDRMQKKALAIMGFITVVQCWLLYITQTGASAVSMKFILAAVCLLFAVIGNYMPNLKPNYIAGFRLPWTLKNEDNWRRTHYLAGRVWFAGGLTCMFLFLLLPFKIAVVLCGILLVVMLVLPALYSYRLLNRQDNMCVQAQLF